MKKLFVLFLLVALVPFTVGCGLFGDNDDTTPVNVTKLTASALLPAAAASNLRGAAVAANKFKGFVMSLNGVELTAETEEETAGGFNVRFGRVVTTTEYAQARQGLVPVVIRTAAAKTIVSVYVNTNAVTVSAPLAVTVTGDSATGFSATGATVGESSTSVVATDHVATIDSFSYAKDVHHAFTAVFSADIFGSDFATVPTGVTYDVEVRKAGGSYKEALSSDFSFTYTASTKTLVATLIGKSLTAGQSYEIVVRSIVNGAKSVASKTFTFTAK